ncbi:MAG: glycoside hydrolase family 95 protein [Treponema sp.]|jgi:alpha-L-fucosidase 2|nr:glycoside hydrolase family 95 protein [Treponema sp.]
MSEDLLVWEKEAKAYYEAAPVGNGRIGVMMFGSLVRERIVLNESSMWSGSVQDADRPEAYKVLPELRELLLAEEYQKAEELFKANFTCLKPGSAHAEGANSRFGCYQTLGDLNLYFYQAVSAQNEPLRDTVNLGGAGYCEGVSSYSRRLDLSSGIASMEYRLHNGSLHSRECLASRTDDCAAIRFSSSEVSRPAGVPEGCRHRISFNAQLSRPEKYTVEAFGNDGLIMTGQLENGVDGKGVRYAAIVRAGTEEGSVYVEDRVLCVRGAKAVTLYITMATDYRGFAGRQCPDARRAAEEDMDRVYGKDWAALRAGAETAHRELYRRSSFTLEGPKQSAAVLEKRLEGLRRGTKDLGLYELLYNFGRYLLIAANRPGGLPANLQGIWGDEIQTFGNGDWHIDAEEMNFWGAEPTSLPELHEPYLALIASLTGPGSKTAKAYYNARGWVAHVITNPWGFTSPGEDAAWGATTCGSPWLCQHVWDHFLYSNDVEYLKQAYPILKGCALFYLDILIRDPKTGYLVTAPANSPENFFISPDGKESALCAGPTVDSQLSRYVFSACIAAAGILGTDAELVSELTEKRALLAPSRVGPDGGVAEWLTDYVSARPNHRHVSHLWGVFPGDEITPEDTPALARAVKRTIVLRGKASPGWATMHRSAILARIEDGDGAEAFFDFYLRTSVYPNLFCRTYHAPETARLAVMPEPDDYSYPFQIDANLAFSGCVAEMLLQSHRFTLPASGSFIERIHCLKLLPALPGDWESGSVLGLRGRGGFTVNITWRDQRLSGVVIQGKSGAAADVSYQDRTVRISIPRDGVAALNGKLESVK